MFLPNTTMSLILPENFPAIEILRSEHIEITEQTRSVSLHVRPLRLAILNLMPLKIDTEVDLLRILAQSPLHIEITWMSLATHTPTHVSPEHMQAFYQPFPELKEQKFDGFIVTGAPVEHMPFEKVGYWSELSEIFRWARTHVTSTLYICWAAQAGLYFHYDIPKHALSQKMFGIFEQRVLQPYHPLMRGMDDVFFMPHSRHTEVRREDIEKVRDLSIIAESPVSGVAMVVAREGREVFVTGHSEYAPYTLDTEYKRDLSKGLPIQMPVNYYRNDNPELGPQVRWRTSGVQWYLNWLHTLVYQKSPYNFNEIK